MFQQNGVFLQGAAAMNHQIKMHNDVHYRMENQNRCLYDPLNNSGIRTEPLKNNTFLNHFDTDYNPIRRNSGLFNNDKFR